MGQNKVIIRDFLSRFVGGQDLADGDDIFAMGIINSLAAMQLVTWIEKEFDIAVEDEDLEIANFRSIEAVDAFIIQKKQVAARNPG
jgi:acyl carrier protein